MTAIIAWRSPAGRREAVHVVGDSRVTEIPTNYVWLDDAVKILPLSIQASCTDLSVARGVSPYYTHTIGYAFAGSSLIGLNTYAQLATGLASLIGLNPDATPPLEACARLGAELLVSACATWNERHERKGRCTALVFGYCHVVERPQVFLLHAGGIDEVSIQNPRTFAHIGQAQEEIETRIVEVRSLYDEHDGRWWSAPKKVLEEFIDNEQFPGIGGSVTMAIGSADGVDLFSEARASANMVGPCFPGPGAVWRER